MLGVVSTRVERKGSDGCAIRLRARLRRDTKRSMYR